MERWLLATIISEGGRLVSEFLRARPPRAQREQEVPAIPEEQEETPERPQTAVKMKSPTQATDVATGCVPCALGHFGTCSGLLNEGMRFAQSEGMDSPEVSDRINMCLDELNTMERVDLRPELIADLSEWEKELANQALVASRATRHRLEAVGSVTDFESIAADTQRIRNEIGRTWFSRKLKHMPPEDKEEVHRRVMERLEQLGEEPAEGETERVAEYAEGATSNPGPQTREDRPTPAQIRHITRLCGVLRIDEPVEEQVRTLGEAGQRIRELEGQVRLQKARAKK